MSLKCGDCGHENLNAVSGDNCSVCSAVLGPVQHEIPPTQGSGVLPLNLVQPNQTTNQPGPDDLFLKFRTFGLKMVEGTVETVQPLKDEKPDPEISMIFVKILLFLDILLVMGSIGLAMLGVSLIFIIIGLIFSIGCILPVAVLMVNLFFVAVVNMLRKLFGNGNELPLPVSKYVILTDEGKKVTVRVKGQLRGAELLKSDYIRVWGIFRDGIIHFRYGVNQRTGEAYLLPNGYGGIWLAILIFLNIIFGIWILFQFRA